MKHFLMHTGRLRPDQVALVVLVAFLALVTAVTLGLRSTARPSVPGAEYLTGFSATRARHHLERITVTEHPTPSRANWDVRAYLATVLGDLASSPAGQSRGVTLVKSTGYVVDSRADDLLSFRDISAGDVTVMQSSNLYLRIPGKRERESGDRTSLMLSSHYDSVATSRGVGDDGLGVVAMLELARVLIESPTALSYSVLLNFNNAEETGLYGAQATVRDPLWRDVAAFINIDSVCPTGRPLLYRSTSREMVEIFQQFAPHGFVIAANSYPLCSSVYWRHNVTGVDFAFYDRRWVYHTDLDALPLVEDESIAHLGVNILGLMRGIDTVGIEHVRRLPERRNAVVFTDYAGHSMLVLGYRGLAVVLLASAAVFVLVPAAWSAAFAVTGSAATRVSIRPWSGHVLGVRLRAWTKSTLAVLGALFANLVATTLVLGSLLTWVQPMAVSGRPGLILVLGIATSLLVSALTLIAAAAWAAPHVLSDYGGGPPSHLGVGRLHVRVQRGTLGAWLVLLVLAGVTATTTAFLSHFLWFAVCLFGASLAVDALAWTALNTRPALLGHTVVVTTATESPHRHDDDDERTTLLPVAVPKIDPATAAVCRALLTPQRSRGRAWGYLLLFAAASAWPLLVTLDLALNYVMGLAFSTQEGLPGWVVAAFVAFMAGPVALNTGVVFAALSPRTLRGVVLTLSAVVFVLCSLAAVLFPFTPAAPLKLQLAITTASNTIVGSDTLASLLAGTGSTIPLTMVPPPAASPTVSLAMMPAAGSQAVDPAALLGDGVKPDACNPYRFGTRRCTYPASALGAAANVTWPAATFALRRAGSQAPQLPSGEAPMAELTMTVPAGFVTCSTTGIAPPSLAGDNSVATLVVPAAGPKAIPLRSNRFTYLHADPHSAPVELRMYLPRAWLETQWSLQCRVHSNDGVLGQNSTTEPYALYREVLRRVPDWVAVTLTERGLVAADYAVNFMPANPRPQARGDEWSIASLLSMLF
ncbi:hypothetical protein H9P43_007787 [Blastocladiella emersonii ATCC 22665]|nr:hypothetical protein H9P43_007787 [Blastocladiella emersonii ATCC 22665]